MGKLESYVQNNKTGPLSYTTCENKLKWINELNGIPEIIKLMEENVGRNLLDIHLSNIFLDLFPQAKETKAKKKKKWEYIKWKAFLEWRNYQQSKKATYWMGEDICKWYCWKGVNS